MKHACIKCRQQYDSSDPDPYYCDTCTKTKEQVAKEVDKKLASRPRKRSKSALQAYDEMPRPPGINFPRVRL